MKPTAPSSSSAPGTELRVIFSAALLFALLPLMSSAETNQPHSTVQVEAWEHGQKTPNVKATRYNNPDIGYNIGFEFPGHENNCDRQEIVDFIAAHGGFVYQCGGSPGAEMFATFKGVKDRDSANAKLTAILPEMDKLVASL